MADRNAPRASSKQALVRMKSTRQSGTNAEMLIRSELHRRGLRYRVQRKVLDALRRKVDIVFQSSRVAVFVDGCFWHGCPLHGTWPKENAEFWKNKIERNKQRDADSNDRLAESGWFVIRIWEHEEPRSAVDRVEEAVRSRQLQ